MVETCTAIASGVHDRGSLVECATIRFVPNVACEDLVLLWGVRELVGVEAVGLIERGGRMGVVRVDVGQVGKNLVVGRCGFVG